MTPEQFTELIKLVESINTCVGGIALGVVAILVILCLKN